MNQLVSFLIFTLIVSFLLSWLVYIPLFMRLLRRFSEEEFRRNGGKYFFFGKSVTYPYFYFLIKDYRRTKDVRIRFHGEILTVTFAYAPIALILLYCLRRLYE